MSKKASNFQKAVMSLGYRGKEIFKPLNTGWIDDHVACVREWIANIFFYTKNGTTIMIDAGYSFINSLAEDNELSKRSLAKLENLLRKRGLKPKVITGHTGWSDDLDFVFAHKDQVCNSMKKQKPHDPNAPYDGYDEQEDTEYNARNIKLAKAVPVPDKIQNAYRSSKNIYDDVLTQGSFFSRLYIRFFWGGTDDNEIAGKNLSYIPNDFTGRLLDVPVGTAVFTEKKWRSLSEAEITCLDYSEDMLEKAKARLNDCRHISFIQGDVGALPMEDASYDIVMSMNGFHAFPDKKKAFKETYRVLRKGGLFIACFYIKGKSKRTDRLVKNILSEKGWFTPPFPTEEQLLKVLHKLYSEVEYHVDGSMVWFKCVK